MNSSYTDDSYLHSTKSNAFETNLSKIEAERTLAQSDKNYLLSRFPKPKLLSKTEIRYFSFKFKKISGQNDFYLR
jgi:hypothetical protein